jgi:hypothetical protein
MSDHLSGPAGLDDPAIDITDFYAFVSPERPGNLVLVMDVFPLATDQSRFSDAVTHRFRLRSLARSGRAVTPGRVEYRIDVTFDDPPGRTAQRGRVVTSDGRDVSVVVAEPLEQAGMRVFAGLASDPCSMDVEAAVRTDPSGQLALDRPVNTVLDRDVLSIVVEVPFAPIVECFGGATLIAAVSETLVAQRGISSRLERLGRPEIKNVIIANPSHDPRADGVELRDLYDREDAFAVSKVYRAVYESRLDSNLAFFDGLDRTTAWPIGADGRHPLRDLFLDDFLILDLAHAFAPGGFLEIERAIVEGQPHASAGGRWLDDDVLDVLLTWMVNGGRDELLGEGVDVPTRPASLFFPYVCTAGKRSGATLRAFSRS